MALSLKQEQFVSAYVGEANGNATAAARIAGYKHPNVLGSQLLVKPSIQEAVAAYREQIRRDGIAHQQNRIDSYRDDFMRTERVIAARAEAYASAPGGDSGLLAGRLKSVKHVDTTDDAKGERTWAEEAWEYEVDTALLNERLKLRKQIAQELGDWTEKSENRQEGSVTIRVIYEDDHA